MMLRMINHNKATCDAYNTLPVWLINLALINMHQHTFYAHLTTAVSLWSVCLAFFLL